MQAAAFRQLLLRPAAYKAQQPQLARKLIPCLPLHVPISGPRLPAVHSTPTAKGWRYTTTCSAFVASLVGAVLLSGCTAAAVAPVTAAGLPESITTAANDTCDVVADCAAIGVGARACGGPATYLVYSRTTSDVLALTRAVAAYNRARAEALRREGAMGTCDVIPAPRLACIARRCVAAAQDQQLPLPPQ